MKNPFSFFKSFFFWSLLRVSCLLILIWFIGPEIAIGSVKPLLSDTTRIIVCMGIIAIWLSRIIYRHWREIRRYALISGEIKASQESILKKSADDETVMGARFAEIDKILKNSKLAKTKYGWLDSGQYIYQLPWYIVLGASGSGKTTALKQSGLDFPLESTLGSSIDGLTATQDFDWFLTDEALLLDTAGRLSVHGKQHGNRKNSKDWEEFVTLLKQYRPKQPINGLVVTVGVDNLLGNSADLLDLATELKRRIQEMRIQFGIDFPIYLTITKLDLLHGFNSFFLHLTEEERNKYFGIPFHNENMVIDHGESITMKDILVQITKKLRLVSSTIASNLNNPTERAAAFVFPEEFGRLSQALLKFLQELSKSSKFEEPVQWRGIYFSSAIQNGKTVSFIEKKLYHSFQLNQRYSETTKHFQVVDSFFLNKLFSDVIFSESSLAGENKAWFVKRKAIYWSGITAITSVTTTVLMLMLISYFNNSVYLNEVKEKAMSLSAEMQKVKKSNFISTIDFTDRIKKIVESKDISDLDAPPFDYRMGLYQGIHIRNVADLAHKRLLHDGIVPLISYHLDDLLRNVAQEKDDINFTYNALKAYLMMFRKERDNDFMHGWLIQNLNDEKLNDVQKKAVSQAVKDILQEKITFSVPYDQELVDRRRRELSASEGMNIKDIILKQIAQEVENHKDKLTPVSFVSMGGAESKALFQGKDMVELTDPINSAYTAEAYFKIIAPSLEKNTAALFEENSWVLGNYAIYNTSSNSAQTLKDVKEQYFKQYSQAWESYLKELELRLPNDIGESEERISLLAQEQSPLVRMIIGISENTTLGGVNELNVEQKKPITLLEKTISIMEGSLQAKYKEMLNSLFAKSPQGNVSDQEDVLLKREVARLFKEKTPVDEKFENFHKLIRYQNNGSSVTIDVDFNKIKDFYAFVKQIRHIKEENGVPDLSPGRSIVDYEIEVGKLPEPFKGMLLNFLKKVLAQKSELEKEAEDKKKEAEEKQNKKKDEESINALMSSLTNELKLIKERCEIVKQDYPFQSISSSNDASIEDFVQIFGANGIYQQFRQLNGYAASSAKADSLDALMANNQQFSDRFAALDTISDIRQIYFNGGGERPRFNFELEVASLDPAFESLHLTYDGKKQIYSHGPVVPMKLSWPSNSEKPQIKLEFFSSKSVTPSIDTSGTWSVFRLIEKGQITKQDSTTTEVRYMVHGKPVKLKFSTSTSRNPFNLNYLRKFECVG